MQIPRPLQPHDHLFKTKSSTQSLKIEIVGESLESISIVVSDGFEYWGKFPRNAVKVRHLACLADAIYLSSPVNSLQLDGPPQQACSNKDIAEVKVSCLQDRAQRFDSLRHLVATATGSDVRGDAFHPGQQYP